MCQIINTAKSDSEIFSYIKSGYLDNSPKVVSGID